jgi:hypothetical protein
VIEPGARAGKGLVAGGANSFGARLAELEQKQATVEFIIPLSSAGVSGRVIVRASDHVIAEDADSQEWVVPLKGLAAVVERA